MTYFVYLKSWYLFLLCSLFASKNHFNFFSSGGGCGGGGGGGGLGLFYIFDVRIGEGFNDFEGDVLNVWPLKECYF